MFSRLALSLVLASLWLWPASLHAQSDRLMAAYRQGQTLYQAGQYEQAVPLWREALELGEQELGPDHLTTATLLNNLAALYEALGHYQAAEPFYQRALDINTAVLGPDHPKVAASLINLARLYDAQSRYFEAEPLYEMASMIREKAVEPDNSNLTE